MFVKFSSDLSKKKEHFLKKILFSHLGIKEFDVNSFEIFYTYKEPTTNKPFIWIKINEKKSLKAKWEYNIKNGIPYIYTEDDIIHTFLQNMENLRQGIIDHYELPYWDIFIKELKDNLIKLSNDTKQPLMIVNPYPPGFKNGGIISHDIDLMRKWGLKKLLKKPLLIKEFFKELSGNSDYYTFPMIINQEKQFSITSSFYFMSTSKDLHSTRYKLEKYRLLLEDLADNNCEIGLHITRNWYGNYNEISYQIKRFQNITGISSFGVRFHYLKYNSKALEILSDYHIIYDTSVGSTDKLSFPALTSKPYPIPDTELWEIPFGIMDSVFYGKSRTEIVQTIREYLDIAEGTDGIMHLLIHQHSYDTSEFPNIKPSLDMFFSEYSKKIYWQTVKETLTRFRGINKLYIKKLLKDDKKDLLILSNTQTIKDITITFYNLPGIKNITGTLSSYITYKHSSNTWELDIPLLPENSPLHITMEKR